MQRYDITLLTDHRYLVEEPGNWYIDNILTEDRILRDALEARGLRVHRTHWDNPDFDWSSTRFALFRTTWDYFDRFGEFSPWLEATSKRTQFINPMEMLRWNMDKHYLADLKVNGIAIPPTVFIEKGDHRGLGEWMSGQNWEEFVLKPAVSGAARHTYRIKPHEAKEFEEIFRLLIANEAMLLQEFMHNVPTRGEVALMVMGGEYTHAVLKRAKEGDFRVQDDFGGTLHDYHPSEKEIDFAIKAVQACPGNPLYARVDMIWNNQNQPVLSELELIEPELWFRREPDAAEVLAEAILEMVEG